MSNRNYNLDVTRKQGHVRVTRTPKSNAEPYAVVRVSLHGHTVFEADYNTRTIKFSMCGWYTASSRDVINRALSEFRPDMRVFKQNHIWRVSFANGEEQAALEACENKKYGF